MKYILTDENGNISGPFNTVDSTDYGFFVDGITQFRTDMLGVLVKSSVPDDYINQQTVDAENAIFNRMQSDLRSKAYLIESDPIFFQYQRGSKTEQEWLDAVNAVKTQFPYKE
jgi:hypothetical protein